MDSMGTTHAAWQGCTKHMAPSPMPSLTLFFPLGMSLSQSPDQLHATSLLRPPTDLPSLTDGSDEHNYLTLYDHHHLLSLLRLKQLLSVSQPPPSPAWTTEPGSPPEVTQPSQSQEADLEPAPQPLISPASSCKELRATGMQNLSQCSPTTV